VREARLGKGRTSHHGTTTGGANSPTGTLFGRRKKSSKPLKKESLVEIGRKAVRKVSRKGPGNSEMPVPMSYRYNQSWQEGTVLIRKKRLARSKIFSGEAKQKGL